MNRDMTAGAVRNVKGRANTAIGGATGNIGRQADGMVDQVAGGTRYLYGKATDRTEHLLEAGSSVLDETVDRVTAGGRMVARRVEDNPISTAVWVAALAFSLGWLLSPSRHR